MRRRLLGIGTAALTLAACGGGDADAPAETPAPVVEATPEATPEPTPEAVTLEDATVVHVILEEVVAPPPLPERSPLARDVGVTAAGVPSAEYLRWDRARADVVDTVAALEEGYGASGAAIALVEWRIRWGEDAEAGEARRWAVCALPCTVEDGFVAAAAHHPVHPLTQPRPLFAHRPGTADVHLRPGDDGLAVSHGEQPLWQGGEPAGAASGEEDVSVPVLLADGVTAAEWSWTATRTLRVAGVRTKTFALTMAADPPEGSTRVLPRIGANPDKPRLLGVEGVREAWPWPDADRLSGGFKVKPSPADYGLKLERIAKEVLWFPTTRQAGDGKAEFDAYVLTSGATAMTVEPFPDGADVLGGTKAVDGRIVVASPSGFEVDQRAGHVAGMLEHYQTVLPLKDPGDSKPDPWIVYSVKEPVGVVAGSAGPRLFAVTVDDDADEAWSVAQAWARLHLAPHLATRSPAARDFVAWALAQLVDGRPDTSVYMHTFGTAGDDVVQVWRDWLVDPDRKGAADPGEFLAFVERQLPDLAEQLRRDLVERRFSIEALPASLDFEPGSAVVATASGELGGDGAILAVHLPEGASHEPVEVTVTPSGRTGHVRWAARLVAERYWQEAATDPGARAYLLEKLGATTGLPSDEPEAEAETPRVIAPPSQRQAIAEAGRPQERKVTKPRRQGPMTASVQHDDKPAGRSTVLVLVWGDPGMSAEVKVTSAVEAPEEPAEPAEPAAEEAATPAAEESVE